MLKKLFPILEWLPKYKKSYLSGDISAGITVGIMIIPQGMAYAMIAGLPPVFGLYAALLPQVIYAFMGSSRKLAIGAVALDSLLVASGLGLLALSGIEEYIAMAIFLALFVGIVQVVLGILRMGFLANFLSQPVISGFTSAAAIIIGLTQLHQLFGIEISGGGRILYVLTETFEKLETTNLYALAIGVGAILVNIILKRINKKLPGALIVVTLAILTIYFLNLTSLGVKIVGEVPQGLPDFKVPMVETSKISSLLPLALTLAILAFVEAISIAKAVESKEGPSTLDPNQELIALGSANIVGSLFQSYSTTAGFSRTAVNVQAGARTGIAPLVSAALVGLTLLFFTPVFYYLPNAVLAAIILVAVYGLIDIKYPLELFRNRKDEFILLVLTFLITLGIGITEGIVLGVLFSLLLLLYRTSKPHIAILGRIKGTDYFKNVNRFSDDIETVDEVLAFRFDSQLYFANKDYFKKQLYKHMAQKGQALKYIILNAEAINYIDSSAVNLLKQIVGDLKTKEIQLLIAGAIGPTRDTLFTSGLAEAIGSENLFVRTHEAFDACQNHEKSTDIQRKISRQIKGKA